MQEKEERKGQETPRGGEHYPERSEESQTEEGGIRSHLELGDTHGITVFGEFQRFEFPPEANPKQCHYAVAPVVIRIPTDDVHDGTRPMLVQDHGVQPVKAKCSQ